MVSDTLRSHLHPDQIAPLRDRLPARLIALLEQAGDLAERTAVSAFVVGGFVRDLLLGRPNLDVDLVIEGDGIAYARALARAVGGSVKVHDRFGTTIVIFPDGFKLDVATARTESYDFPTALPTVKRSSIKEDLYRRDFTINTLAIRLNTGRFGELIDVFGGQRDLNEKTIRVLHSLSFVEDPTRVFRAVRFEQRFGFRLGKETLALIKGTVKMDLFRHLSSSRLSDELILLLSEEAPRKIVARLGELALLRCIHPALKWSTRLDALLKAVEEALNWHEMASSKRSDRKVRATGGSSGSTPGRLDGWLVYFMALMEVIPGRAVGVTLKRLGLPERHAEKIRIGRYSSSSLLRRLAKRPALRPADVYRVLVGLSDETLLLLRAKTRSGSVKRRIAAHVTTYRHVRPAMSGADLKALGLKPGPIFGRILDRLLDARLNGEVQTEADERDLVKRLVDTMA
ncbi:MAG: CCA tRNA nucleotidyltransferase [Nitrospiraceae bacterium]